MKIRSVIRFTALMGAIAVCALLPSGLVAQAPIANTVPFVASNPTSPHTSWSGNPVTLKGTLTSPNFPAHTFTYDWNPGDGGTHCTGTISDQYDVECSHVYTGATGTVFTAVLTITDTTSSLVSPVSNRPPSILQGACYYTSLNPPPPNLPVEVNNAIDNGLWYIHKQMVRTTSAFGAPIGNWYRCDGSNADVCQSGDTGPSAIYCTAFEDSGFLTTNNPPNPYSADVQLCLNGAFDFMTTIGVSNVVTGNFGTYNPDSNGNGIGIGHNGGYVNYQTGMSMDMVAAAGTPAATVPSNTGLGNALIGIPGTGAGGAYTFKDAMIDMTDDYAYCLNPGSSSFGANSEFGDGGWHYTCQETDMGDNSVSQWAAIGIIPARRNFGSDPLNPAVLTLDQNWLTNSFFQASTNNGYFGYTSSSPLWGPYAVTPAGLVQLAMNGKGRGTTVNGINMWDSAETFIRDNFGTPQSAGAGSSMKDYYYGLFSFTKAMILHDNSGTGLGNTPLTTLQSMDDPGNCAAPGVPVTAPGSGTGPCYPAIDWYAAQTPAFGGTDPTDGVARTIVGNQNLDGSWFGQNFVSNQDYFQTAVAIIMLNKTVFNPVPVACFTADPNQLASGGTATLDGRCSVEQNPANTLVTWQWDVSGTNAGFSIGPGSPQCLTNSCSEMKASFTLPAGQGLPYSFPVKLKVTDSGGLVATVTGSVVISAPPNPPVSNAGGPYSFCPNTNANGGLIYAPFLLDGSKLTNPDQGKTDGTPNAPPSTIIAYDWDYSCSGAFTSAHVVQPNATTAFDVPADFGTSFNICLRVTNNDLCATHAGQTANPPLCAFPTGPVGTLSSVGATGVTIHNPTDEACTHCVQTLSGAGKPSSPGVAGYIGIYWTDTDTSAGFPIDHYNIYRSNCPGSGPVTAPCTGNFTPYAEIAGASSNPFLPAVQAKPFPGGGQLYFQDNHVTGGNTYYYRIAPATANDNETCQGNVTLAVTIPKGR